MAIVDDGGAAAPGHGQMVCVTGAGGYVGLWIFKLLLENTLIDRPVRDVCADDAKNAHLRELAGAAERLELFKADLLDYGALCAAITGCTACSTRRRR
ncbi:hypothetical protein E2562_011783 [Oryza meyeriana var. granulata]|uniref:NAD-dependent epimerase/dehydratase domain-containing protein n=1 Tax=Oryza meyeriana var. granulata TaxID=110450 RepID=A0A6G1CPB0_9ORYZ|nr:hypothetical protein E2562_011783 [Oryza meyeriana var. granulata]